MAINRAPFNALVDDDGTNTTGSVWNKTAIKEVILDPVDAALVSSGVTLPINLTTQVTGTLQAAQEPAHTGDVTGSAGSLALTIASNAVTSAKIASGAVTNAKLANPVTVVMTDGATISLDAFPAGADLSSHRRRRSHHLGAGSSRSMARKSSFATSRAAARTGR